MQLLQMDACESLTSGGFVVASPTCSSSDNNVKQIVDDVFFVNIVNVFFF